MDNLQELIMHIPEMKQGQELISALSVLPEYHDNVRNENQAVRLMELSAIQRIYVPSEMSIEIYLKMYLALVRSLQKKVQILPLNIDMKIIKQYSSSRIMGFWVVLIRLQLLELRALESLQQLVGQFRRLQRIML